MTMLRTVICNICDRQYTEESYGAGFAGWMQVNGIILNGDDQVWLCPDHKAEVADYIDNIRTKRINL